MKCDLHSAQSRPKIGLCHIGCLPWQPMHQINIPSVKAGVRRHIECSPRVITAVNASQGLQQRVMKCLDANAEPGDTTRLIVDKTLRFSATRVAFSVISASPAMVRRCPIPSSKRAIHSPSNKLGVPPPIKMD